MRRAVQAIAAGIFAASVALLPAHADETAEQVALEVVSTLVHDAHDAMTAGDMDQDARFATLTEAIGEAFAFDVWERFLLGEHDLSPGQRETFRELLPGFLANLYAERFGKGLEARPEVVGARSVRRDVLVKARIPRPNAEPLPVEYRVRDFEGRGPQVIDIMVGGVSFLLLKRDEFGAIIENQGVDALLDFMRERAI